MSDIILESDLKTWKRGDRILISASTGTGKTQFVLGKLYDFFKDKKVKILFLINRLVLKDQIENYLTEEHDKKILNIKTYQGLEHKSSLFDFEADNLFSEYDVIILDEAHYLISDSSFSRRTDIVLKYILRDRPDKLLVFLSATPYNLTETKIIRHTKKYTIEKKYYEDIDNLYFYYSRDIPERIIDTIPENEKILFFGAANIGYKLFSTFPNSSFICATSNKNFGEYSSEEELKNIVGKERFQRRILFTTRVMVNGVTLKDPSLKHIIIDDSLDPISLIQMIGRKRILDDSDKINLYIRSHPNNTIKTRIRIIKKELLQVEKYLELGYDEFKKQYKKEDISGIFDSDAEINLARKYAKEFELKKLELMIDPLRAGSFAVFVGRILGVPESKDDRWNKYMQNADKVFRLPKSIDVLDKYFGKKLFGDDKKIFKDEFLKSMLYSPASIKRVGLNTLQGIFSDNKIPYTIESEREHKGDKRGNNYWIIKKIVSQ